MKKIFALILSIFMCFTVASCTLQNEQTQMTIFWENFVDVEAIKEQIYNEVKEQIEADLYDEIYDELYKKYIEPGTFTFETLQEAIYRVVTVSKKSNVLVTKYKTTQGEEIASSTGSGVIYRKEASQTEGKYIYYVFTNQHVVEDGTTFSIEFEDESLIPVTLVGADATTDIAVLKFESENTYYVATLGTSENIKVGQVVIACGNPKGSTLFGSINFGIVGGLDRNLLEYENGTYVRNTINKYIQHDAAINPGNSGGGLYNLDGEVVGINSVKYAQEEVEGLNFSIPIDLFKIVEAEIRTTGSYGGNVKFGISCVNVTDLTATGRINYGVPSNLTSGVLVTQVAEDGCSYNLLQANDIIYKIDSTDILSMTELQALQATKRIGDTILIYVYRNGVKLTTPIELTFTRSK